LQYFTTLSSFCKASSFSMARRSSLTSASSTEGAPVMPICSKKFMENARLSLTGASITDLFAKSESEGVFSFDSRKNIFLNQFNNLNMLTLLHRLLSVFMYNLVGYRESIFERQQSSRFVRQKGRDRQRGGRGAPANGKKIPVTPPSPLPVPGHGEKNQ